MRRRKIKEITKEMFADEMERMGFQVYRGGFWFRIDNGLASVFGVRRSPALCQMLG